MTPDDGEGLRFEEFVLAISGDPLESAAARVLEGLRACLRTRRVPAHVLTACAARLLHAALGPSAKSEHLIGQRGRQAEMLRAHVQRALESGITDPTRLAYEVEGAASRLRLDALPLSPPAYDGITAARAYRAFKACEREIRRTLERVRSTASRRDVAEAIVVACARGRRPR